jgi:hypothetical protein
MVNHFYVYAVDADFGPFFVKFASYFPYNAKLCINGNEWAKRQAAKTGLRFEALPDIATTSRSCRLSSRSPRCSTGRWRVECSSRR